MSCWVLVILHACHVTDTFKPRVLDIASDPERPPVMPATPNPVVDKLQLAKDLRRQRDEKGMTQQQVAEKLGWSREKVGRIETASVSVSLADVRHLLHLYEIVDADVVQEFERRAEAAQRPGWNE